MNLPQFSVSGFVESTIYALILTGLLRFYRWTKGDSEAVRPVRHLLATVLLFIVGIQALRYAAGVAARPFLPVKALALPELTTRARAFPDFSFSRHHSTGAEGHFERVSTPATLVPGSNNASSTSVRPA